MSLYEAAARLTAFVLCVTVGVGLVWLLLEWGWDWLWDELTILKARARRARTMAEYQTVARRHRRAVRG